MITIWSRQSLTIKRRTLPLGSSRLMVICSLTEVKAIRMKVNVKESRALIIRKQQDSMYARTNNHKTGTSRMVTCNCQLRPSLHLKTILTTQISTSLPKLPYLTRANSGRAIIVLRLSQRAKNRLLRQRHCPSRILYKIMNLHWTIRSTKLPQSRIHIRKSSQSKAHSHKKEGQ